MDDGLLAPHRVERFTEHWFPVNALGGPFNEATPAGALRVTIEDGRARVAANFTSRFDGALFVVEAPAATVHSEQVNLSPETPFAAEINLPDVGATEPLTVIFKGRDGRELIRYRTDTPVDGNADFKPAARPAYDAAVPNSAGQIYLAGLAAEKRGNDAPAREAYREALRRDPGFAQAHTRLALSFYRGGEYERAAAHALAALGRNRDAAEAHYYFGLAQRAERKWAAAAEQMRWLVRAGGEYESIAHYQLGEMALVLGHNDEAIEELSEAVRLNPGDIKGRAVLALAERLAGRPKGAAQRIEAVLKDAPLDYLALSERAEIGKALGREAEAARAADELWRLLGREPDSVLELAFDYAAAGQIEESRRVLEDAIKQTRTAGRAVYPMLHYSLGHFYEQGGDTARALAQYRLGAQASPSFVFPHRVEEIEALSAALRLDNRDGRAAYYLGNVLAAKNRWREALAAWRDAVRLDPANQVARRNLALALWQVAGEKEQALAEYKQALKASAEDYHLYLETDRLMAELGQTGERASLLEAAPAEVRSQSAIAQALAAAYVDAGRFADAARLLEGATFTSGEGEYGPIAIYRKAHLGLARGYEREGKYKEAAAEYLKTTEYPENLGAGRHAMQSQAREYVAAARALELAGERGEALKWWQRAAEDVLTSPTQPEEPWSEHYYWKAFALERVGKKPQAEALYRRLARLADEEAAREAEASVPQGAIRFALAGAGLKALGQRDRAQAALEQALKMEPGNELAHLQLADLKRERHARARP
jgi:tetratricopeptide (TPR) repeat protein